MSELDAIISDCGVALYPILYWRDLTNWDELLADSLARNYPYHQLLSRIRGFVEKMRGSESGIVVRQEREAIDLLRDMAREQHWIVYEWFRATHVADYIGCIPADIRGIIEHYLRSHTVIKNITMTAIMGNRHSFNDEPAEIINYSLKDQRLQWFHAGHLHREGQPADIMIQRSSVDCYWYSHGKIGYIDGRIGIKVNSQHCQSIYDRSYGHVYIIESDSEIRKVADALRLEYVGKP